MAPWWNADTIGLEPIDLLNGCASASLVGVTVAGLGVGFLSLAVNEIDADSISVGHPY